jgi:TolB-like protein/Tfp pilus assembly protein PilF
VNFSPDSGEEYFSDGLAEELIGALARIDALRVAARTSSFAFKGRTGDVREIGEALNVATVLEGSLRRDGERLLVTVQLIDVADGFHLWSETYERRFTEIFDLQRDLALQIAAALEAELTPGERARLASRPTEHLEAYTSYLKGRHFWNSRTPIGYQRALDYFERATALDPEYAEAWAGLAGVYALQGLAGAVEADSARPLARTAALRAIELDGGNAEAHTVLGLYLHTYEWDAAAAEHEFLQAIALDPGNALARQSYGNLLGVMGRIDEALEHKQRAVDLEPLVPALSETLAFTLIRAGRLDEARRHVQNALELDSTFWRAHAVTGLIHEQLHQHDDAIRAYERANELARASMHRTKADIARVLARSGRRDEARRLVGELRAEAESTGVYEPSVATVLLALGDPDASFAWLDHAFRQRHPHLAFIGGDARFAGFDREPRFGDMMRRVGLWR